MQGTFTEGNLKRIWRHTMDKEKIEVDIDIDDYEPAFDPEVQAEMDEAILWNI